LGHLGWACRRRPAPRRRAPCVNGWVRDRSSASQRYVQTAVNPGQAERGGPPSARTHRSGRRRPTLWGNTPARAIKHLIVEWRQAGSRSRCGERRALKGTDSEWILERETGFEPATSCLGNCPDFEGALNGINGINPEALNEGQRERTRTITQTVFPEIQAATEALERQVSVTEAEIAQMKEDLKAKKALVKSWRKALARIHHAGSRCQEETDRNERSCGLAQRCEGRARISKPRRLSPSVLLWLMVVF
jgi:hypothetical protein